MRHFLLPITALVLAACSSEPGGEQESAGDFASRIGQQESGSPAMDPAARAEQPSTVDASVPQDADVTQLQQLADIGGVDFGPRDGGCTFMDGSREILIASGLDEPTLPGKAVVRVGGRLVLLDGQPGGLAAIKSGTSFSGQGVAVQVAPAEGGAQTRPANLSVTSVDGKTANYSGNWICA